MKRLKAAWWWKAVGAGVTLTVVALLALALLSSPLGPGVTRLTQQAVSSLTERVTTVTTPLPVVVEQLQGLNRLECARQINTHNIEAESQAGILPAFLSRDRLEMIVQTEVIAGVDLSRLSSQDISVEEGVLTLRLPPPEVFTVRIDDRGSHVYHRERGWLVLNQDKGLEREARLKAHAHARHAARTARLLQLARENAEANLRQILQPAGFQEIRFLWKPQWSAPRA